MNRNGCLSIIAIIVAILVLVWWFFLRETPELPEVRDSDAGNYSFVRQAVPLLQGRKIKGYDEVKALADLAAATSRRTLVEMMIEGNPIYRREYIEHWASVIVDWMRVHRDTPKSQSTCFGSPALASVNSGISNYIMANGPAASAQGYSLGGSAVEFNMSDVLRSSLHADNMASAYLAYLFPMVNKPIGGAEVTEQNRRSDLGATLTHVYTHRQMGCLACHNTLSSTTGPASHWNRHYPIFGNFEKALFGFNTGRDSREVAALLRTDVRLGGSQKPWGMDDCGIFKVQSAVANDSLMHPNTGMPLDSYLVQNHGRTGTVWTLESLLRNGIQKLSVGGLSRGPDTETTEACEFCENSCDGDSPIEDAAAAAREAAVQTLVNNRCVSCHINQHDSWAGSNWKNAWISLGLVVPGNSATSAVIQRVTSTSSPMPPSYAQPASMATPLTTAEVDTIRQWIDGLVDSTGDCGVCPNLVCDDNVVDGEEAFAYLVANRVVSNTWSEIFGPHLTIANYFPRNSGQGSVLWNLTENVFLSRDWSMQGLLTSMLTSDYFNRKPPLTSAGTYAYELPMFLDPWVEGDPRFPPQALPGWQPGGSLPQSDPAWVSNTNEAQGLKHNAMTEAIHRYTPRSLLYSMHAALGWPEPQRFGSGSAYPSNDLQKSMGQFWRDAEPGFKEVDFQGLLMWESVQGQCTKPANHSGNDWVDRLVSAAGSFNASNPGAGVTYRDFAISVKDWLLGYAHIQTNVADTPQGMSETEHQSLTALFGNLSTQVPLTTNAERNAAKEKLRAYCGVLVGSPQFLLAGIAPPELGERPRLRQCNDPAELCSYRQICDSFSSAMRSQGYILTCADDTLNVSPAPPSPPFILVDLCVRGFCGFMDRPRSLDCLIDPSNCPLEPPRCDPTCATIDCCGGPLPPLELDRPGYLLADFAGARVEGVKGIQIRRKGEQEFVALTAKSVLQAGDLLALNAQGELTLALGEERFQTPKGGMPQKGQQGTWYLMVTAEEVYRSGPSTGKIFSKIPEAYIQEGLKARWNRYGEAGAPRLDGQVEERDDRRSMSFIEGEIVDEEGIQSKTPAKK